MKLKLLFLLTKSGPVLRQATFLFLTLLLARSLAAQTQNCDLPAGSGGTLSTGGSVAYIGSLSPSLTLSGESSGLDLVQFIFTNPNDLVFDDFSGTTGPRILLANNTGRVDAGADLGLVREDEFCVFSWSFSLGVLQDQVDTLYSGEFLGVACCLFAEATQGVDVCSLLVDAGILEGADLEDFNDIADFAVAYGIQPTFPSIAFLVDSFINVIPPGAPCTPGGRMCYATSNTVCFTVDTGTVIAIAPVDAANWISQFQSGPNPVRGQYQISFVSTWSGSAQLEVTDLTGRQVMLSAAVINPGKNALQLDFSGLVPGYHTLRIKTPDWTTSVRALVE